MQSLPRFNVSNKFCKEDENPLYKTKPLASSTMRSDKPEKSDDLKLGFANLPEQMQRKAVKKGFSFTLMVVGESGLGKTTFINSLLNQNLYNENREFESQKMVESTTKVEKHFIELDEKGVKLRLTIVDTPGFGDGLDCTECWKPIVEYVDDTFYNYFKDECAINRKNIQDNRVHCCLYFISPCGHGLKPIDIELMKVLHQKVNIIPVIAKADSFTEAELKKFKSKVIDAMAAEKINYYQPPICGSDDEDEFKTQDSEIRNAMPFAVIGSNILLENDMGRKCRGRQYSWGAAEVENSKHCNFNILRTFILRTHMQDLKDVTNDILYENYRGELIHVRMTKRNNDRYETMNSKTDSNGSVEDIVDTSSLLQDKDDEILRIKSTITKVQSQISNGSSNNNNVDSNSIQSNSSKVTVPVPKLSGLATTIVQDPSKSQPPTESAVTPTNAASNTPTNNNAAGSTN